jgi:dTMP kinase
MNTLKKGEIKMLRKEEILKNKKMPVISIEGGEGTGKTTILELLKSYLEEKGVDFLVTREPGGVRIAEAIRDIILDVKNTEMDPRTEALLYAAARRQHLSQKVFPAIEKGKLVIFDRYVDSSLIYQGYVRGIGIDEVADMNEFATEGFLPDVTLYFDLDPKVGLDRINKNTDREVNRLDLENEDFHYKVREGYLKLAKKYPERIIKIDAAKTIEEVFNEVVKVIQKYI